MLFSNGNYVQVRKICLTEIGLYTVDYGSNESISSNFPLT